VDSQVSHIPLSDTRKSQPDSPHHLQLAIFFFLAWAKPGSDQQKPVYIRNVLRCRPPGNRDPMADEIELCSPILKRQIALVAPEPILSMKRAPPAVTGRGSNANEPTSR